MAEPTCPFCNPPADRVFYRDSVVIGMWDGFPVTPRHALLVPVRHVPTWFDATEQEKLMLLRSIDIARSAIESHGPVDGYNVGFNSGAAAGQTVFHLHLHVIPRRHGDSEDPRGGVRHVIPSQGNYLKIRDDLRNSAPADGTEPALVTGAWDPFLPHLTQQLAVAHFADFAVAFTMRSGLDLLQTHLQDFLDRGGMLRILTGDYLGATDPDALLRLLDLRGNVECRVYETGTAGSGTAFGSSFHPKAYIFCNRDGSNSAFIGSSNLSETALKTGVEWNYKVLESRDRAGIAEIRVAFQKLFNDTNTRELTPAWIEAYRARRPEKQIEARRLPPDVSIEPPPDIPTPHRIQQEALDALQATRASGKQAGLVVLATGLGKTWLSAFDSLNFKRVLFIAHREEILGQALATFRAIRPQDRLGRYSGTEKDSNAPVLFASIQTLSRMEHLRKFRPEEFDYIVVDEFHHAEARTYRKVLDYFRPTFLLGLTATPERSDGADLLGLCDDNLVYRCDLTRGIQEALLCPFRYFGVPDTVDYRNIPWRSRRFDEDQLTEAVATKARAENILDQYRKRAGQRTLAFCVSQRHADFMRDFFVRNGVSAKSVHSGPSSDPRATSLDALRDGKLDVLCAVDMFNEGVDVPELDTIMMLRPTESRIVWLQQFGRGLRRSSDDKKLTVIDYIGNHRSFMLKPQALFGLPAGDREVLSLLIRLERKEEVLPPGCEVTYDLEVKQIFRDLLRRSDDAVEVLTRRYQDFLELIGTRPTASEMFRERYNPRAMKGPHGSWLGFVRAQKGLTHAEEGAHDQLRGFLDSLEVTEMSKSYKMVTLLAMLNRSALPGKLSVDELVAEVAAIARQHPRVAADLGAAAEDPKALKRLLVAQPIPAWCEGKGTGGTPYFSLEGDSLRFLPEVLPASIESAHSLIREIIDWRLAEYFARGADKTTDSEEYVLKVLRNSSSRPIMMLPDRKKNAELPAGWIDVSVNGTQYTANLVEIAVNVVRKVGSDENVLPTILTDWFGEDAGKPGTRHEVRLSRRGDSWELSPVRPTASTAVPYVAYVRADIPPLFGLKHSEFWRQGFIRQGSNTFLLVTLDKSGQEQAFQYQDHFISPTTFQWQSQNQTARESKAGESIRDHQQKGIDIHLFVRAKGKTPEGRGAPFYYLGCVEFVSWEGDRPITVQWRLKAPVPRLLWKELGIPEA
jgi:superfamily II DNA or RNA helicase/HKD family nuclease